MSQCPYCEQEIEHIGPDGLRLKAHTPGPDYSVPCKGSGLAVSLSQTWINESRSEER